MKKSDIILIASILILSLITLGGYRLYYNQQGAYVEVTIDGELFETLPLDIDTTLAIPSAHGTNLLEIKNGYANMRSASCPDRLCVAQQQIHNNGETLVCLPNKVVVTVVSSKKSQLDSVTY